MALLTMAMLILFVSIYRIFVVHINRMPNAVCLAVFVQKTLVISIP